MKFKKTKMKNKVLIVEDDKFIVKAMTLKFKSSGFMVKSVYTAEEGLTLLKNFVPDVIILDIVLPGINGYEFFKKVKANSKLKNIPIIIASNLTQNEEDTKGATDYIIKSELDLDELVRIANKNIKK